MDDPAFHRRVARDRLGHEIPAAEMKEVFLAHLDIEKLCLKLQFFEVEIGDFEAEQPPAYDFWRAMTLSLRRQLRPGLYLGVSANTPVLKYSLGQLSRSSRAMCRAAAVPRHRDAIGLVEPQSLARAVAVIKTSKCARSLPSADIANPNAYDGVSMGDVF
jgi:hypothetical protein